MCVFSVCWCYVAVRHTASRHPEDASMPRGIKCGMPHFKDCRSVCLEALCPIAARHPHWDSNPVSLLARLRLNHKAMAAESSEKESVGVYYSV